MKNNEIISEEIDEKIKAAYTLNMWTVSVSQIVEYHDIVILKQVKDMIINNLNIEKTLKEEALRVFIKNVMDEITNIEIDEGDIRMVEKEYQFRMKNAIWNSVPQMGAIFATSNPVAMGMTLATQVGMGYMNFRRNKAEYELNLEKSRWEIQKNRLKHLTGLRNSLFDTAWDFAKKYNFPDEYKLAEDQIKEYNNSLAEGNSVKRFHALENMKKSFSVYPPFWYQLGSTANSIYRSDLYADDDEIREIYKEKAIEAFEEYSKLNKYSLLRIDSLTASWALEYLELLGYDAKHNVKKARELIRVAEDNAGNALDIVELCAFAYLRIKDEDNAIRLFKKLVNSDYNSVINTQLLSGLLIRMMRDDEKCKSAKIEYRELKNYTNVPECILEIPKSSVDLDKWKPEWNREDSFDSFVEQKQLEEKEAQLKDEETKRNARLFYQKPIKIIYDKKDEESVAEFFRATMLDIIGKIDVNLPRPVIMSSSEYQNNRLELQNSDSNYILIGKSEASKAVYKNAKSCKWNYKDLGTYYYISGDKTVFILENLKSTEMNKLIAKAKATQKKYNRIVIPDKIGDASTGLLKSMFKDKTPDALDKFIGIAFAGIWAAGEAVVAVGNGVQRVQNALKKKDIDMLRYCIAFYDYLEKQNAIYPLIEED